MINLAWSFWKEKTADSEDGDSESCKYYDARKEENHPSGRYSDS